MNALIPTMTNPVVINEAIFFESNILLFGKEKKIKKIKQLWFLFFHFF
jgi:hypothetical protein